MIYVLVTDVHVTTSLEWTHPDPWKLQWVGPQSEPKPESAQPVPGPNE